MSDRLIWAREVTADFSRSRPGAADLAVLASLAARIEPELLRTLRLQVAPHLDVGAEGDLWFSPLVQGRGPDGITFHTEVADLLRQSLRIDPRRLAAWRVTERCHQSISPALALEEWVTWLALSSGDRAALEEALTPALTALVQEGRTGLASWAARALPRLPQEARATTSAWLLSLAASQRLKGQPILHGDAPADLLDLDVAGLLTDVGETDLAVRREGELLELGESGEEGASTIRVGNTSPRLVEIRWSDGGAEQREVVSVASGAVVQRRIGLGPVRLRTLLGSIYELRLEAKNPPEDQAQADLVYDDFSIRIESSEGRLTAHATSPVGETRTSSQLPSLELEVLDSSERAKEVGGQLFNALFSGEMLMLLRNSLESSVGPPERGLRLRLRFGGTLPEVEELPWELLFDETRQQFFSLDRRTLLIRTLDRTMLDRALDIVEPSRSGGPMRVFISYAWESEEYRSWVKQLATRLRHDGVDARLDSWHLQAGDNVSAFAEREIKQADWVLVLCSPGYREKAQGRERERLGTGVGWEARLLAESMSVARESKVVPALARGSWLESAPDFLFGSQYEDLSNPRSFEADYRSLLQRLTGTQEEAPSPLVRPPAGIEPLERSTPLLKTGPLHLLFVAGAGLSFLGIQEERHRIERSFGSSSRAAIRLLERATPRSLERALREEAYDVLHFAGHGTESELAFEAERGELDRLSSESLVRLVGDASSLKLVVLNSVRSFRLAAALSRSGLPAAIGMQTAVTDQGAITFSEALYRGLAAGQPLDLAVLEGRIALSRQKEMWWAPVLFLNAPEELFQRKQTAIPPPGELAGEDQEYFNGIDGATGKYLPPRPTSATPGGTLPSRQQG